MLKNLRFKIFISLLLLMAAEANAQKRVKFTINTAAERKSISPLIYGTNDNYAHSTARRLGGNRITNYNWENNASNAGRDWYHSSDEYVPWERGVPESEYEVPGAALKYFHNRSVQQGAYSLITLPMAKYVTADKNGAVSLDQAAPSIRWKNIRHRKPTPFSLTPDLNDDFVYTDEEVNFLIKNYGQSSTPTGVKAYALDNEPGIWFESHSRMWGTEHLPVNFLMNSSFELSSRIKELDPNAEVFGPASWGVSEFEDLQGAPDWADVKGNYRNFVSYYLGTMKAKQEADIKKQRLLDVLALHWYPQGRRDGLSPFENGTDYHTNAARMEMTRSLWDPTYREPTWIGEDADKVDQFLPFLPKMKNTIDTHYPGTKFAITEYSFMGVGHPSGGIAQADALGIFGKQGLYFATYWGGVIDYIKAGFDIYQDYDGKGSKFGDISVQSVTDDIMLSSVHASVESADESRTHVVAMNKSQDDAITATIQINSDKVYRGARVWAFDSNGSALRQLKNVRVIENNTFEYVIPPLTVCHLVLTEEDLSLFPDFESASINPSAGYSDGTAGFQIKAQLVDGDHNISKVSADLSQFGGPKNAPMTLANDGYYTLDYAIVNGTPSGLKTITLSAIDSTNRTAETIVKYRVIKKTTSAMIWDGDAIRKGKGEKFYDANDPKSAQAEIKLISTGGSTAPGSLFLHFVHGENLYNVLTWRLSDTDNPADSRDISDYGFVEFKIRSNAPQGSDIELSMRDSSPQLHTSGTVMLKKGGYVSAFSESSYTTVKIPMSAFTAGSEIKLDQVWQFSFSVNTAFEGFDVWIDDIKVVPYSHPYKEPKLTNLTISRAAGYADGETSVTVTGTVEDPDFDLKEVKIDLSEVNGPNNQVIASAGNQFSHTFMVPLGVGYGLKQLTVSAVDSAENSVDKKLSYKINQITSRLTLWDGDHVNTGEGVTVNTQTKVTVDSLGGNEAPMSLNFHMDQATDGFAGAMWDWNIGTTDRQLKDFSDKRYLNFYMKVTPPSHDFDMEVYLKDRFINSTAPFKLKENGFITSYTGNYQLVRVPLSTLFNGSDVDQKQMARFGLLTNQIFGKPLDFKVDDIFVSGSQVADVSISIVDKLCGEMGKIKVDTVIGHAGPFNYYLNGVANANGISNPLFTNLDSGKYLLKIKGPNNFVYLEDVLVRSNGVALKVTGTLTPGNVTVQVTGGSGQYQYLWSNGATTASLTDVPAGTYTLNVTDLVHSCKATYVAVITDSKLVYSVIDAKCGPNGSIRIDQVPGTHGTLTYLLNGVVNPAGSQIPLFSNLTPGTYQIAATDTSGFRKEAQVNVGGSADSLVLTAKVAQNNIDLTVVGASGKYNYKWSNGAVTEDLTGLTNGTYTVIVTDQQYGCSATLSVVVSATPPPTNPILKVTDAACAPNGKILVTNLPLNLGKFSFYINGAANPSGIANPEFSGLKPGTFTIKVTAEGYSHQAKATVAGTSVAPIVTGTAKNGNIDISVKGGSGIYTYQWSEGSTTQDLMQVADGNYTVIVTDAASGCTTTFSATTINYSATMTAQAANCAINGSITVSDVKGGNGQYIYYLNGVVNKAGPSNPLFSGLKPATYVVKVADNQGFSVSKTLTVEGYATAPTVTGVIKGNNITTTVKGGSGAYIYKWSNGSTTAHLTEVPSGTYTLVVTDAASGCEGVYTATILVPYAEVLVKDASCSANGSIAVTQLNATGEVRYSLNNAVNPSGSSEPIFTNLKQGTYTVKVEGSNGFLWTKIVKVGGQANPPVLNLLASNGNVSLQVTGGSGSYSYLWSNGATTRDLREVASGSYTVIVTDAASGCKTSQTVNVSAPVAKKDTSLTIYPNPAKADGVINVKYDFLIPSKRNVVLKDLSGNVLWKTTITEAKGEVNIQPLYLRIGVYIIQVDGVKPIVKRIIIN